MKTFPLSLILFPFLSQPAQTLLSDSPLPPINQNTRLRPIRSPWYPLAAMLSPAWQPAVVGLVVFSGRFDRLQPPAQVSLRVPGFCRSILAPGGLYCQVHARRPIRPYRRLRRRKCGFPLSQFHSDKPRTYQSALCLGQNAERDRNGYCAASLKPPKSLSPTPPRSPQTRPRYCTVLDWEFHLFSRRARL